MPYILDLHDKEDITRPMSNTRTNFKEMVAGYKKREYSMAGEYFESYINDYYKNTDEVEYGVGMPSFRDRLLNKK